MRALWLAPLLLPACSRPHAAPAPAADPPAPATGYVVISREAWFRAAAAADAPGAHAVHFTEKLRERRCGACCAGQESGPPADVDRRSTVGAHDWLENQARANRVTDGEG